MIALVLLHPQVNVQRDITVQLVQKLLETLIIFVLKGINALLQAQVLYNAILSLIKM